LVKLLLWIEVIFTVHLQRLWIKNWD